MKWTLEPGRYCKPPNTFLSPTVIESHTEVEMPVCAIYGGRGASLQPT